MRHRGGRDLRFQFDGLLGLNDRKRFLRLERRGQLGDGAARGQDVLHARHQRRRIERLRHVAQGSNAPRPLGVVRLERAVQKQDRDIAQFGNAPEGLADLVAIELRHDHVAQDDVGQEGSGLLDGKAPVSCGDHFELVRREGQFDDLLNGDAVVGEEQFFSHFGLVAPMNFLPAYPLGLRVAGESFSARSF